MGDKGIDSNSSNSVDCKEWYIVDQAECEEELTDLENLFDESGSDISNLIDNEDEPDQGNSLALLNQQLLEECSQELLDLKRKFISPLKDAELDLSPQLQSVSLSAEPKTSRRRLFEDSGLGNEAENSIETTQVIDSDSCENASAQQSENNSVVADENGVSDICQELLKSRNVEITALAKFKETFGVSYKDLTRTFKSNKTCCNSWVLAVFGVQDELVESSKTLLQTHCEFFQIITYSLASSVLALYLCEFKNSKNRETVLKLLCQLLNVQEMQIMADPPKIKSVVVALYFFKQTFSSTSFKYGEFPEWIKKQTTVSHQTEAETFVLAKMVQFAYDHHLVDDSAIAYAYASIANDDANAAAWLNSNLQAKYLKDCTAMVRHYRRHEMRSMTMSDWIWTCCDKVNEEGDWKVIPKLLKYQGVNFISFLVALKEMFHGLPKKQCIVITGPPNTGKSYFCFSLVNFLQGRVISFMNHKSHFWLQPLKDCKMGFLDDATFPCWQFIDVYMRNALDGTPISLDSKHNNPVQIKLPCLLITSNIEVDKEQQFQYLHSRLKVFSFPNKMPLNDNGTPVYEITDASWNSFFRKLEKQLEISKSLDNSDGESGRAFRCFAGESANAV
ncbi:E1 [Gammapapillomavirus 7]|uniref:Replication protein E1 n=1 Tax=Gammapapillomavirus 7 TaxID=1175849 RepID=A0A2D2ALD6_9PAPI|nr:E1 [Gammapapillomavirus 7]